MSQKFLDLSGLKILLNSLKDKLVSKSTKIANLNLQEDISAEALAAELNGLVGGMDGKSAYEIAQEAGFEGTESEWLASLIGPRGEGIEILGSYASENDLINNHPVGNIGDAYIVLGELFVWDKVNSQWENAGSIQGPKGEQGDPGPKGDTGIQGPKGDTGSSGVWLSDEEPTNPDINIWFNPNGLPDYGLTENDKKEIASYIQSTLSQVAPPTFVSSLNEMVDTNKQYVFENYIYAYVNNNWINTYITYTPVLYTDIIGIVDENNIIRLSANNLPSGTYTLKYGKNEFDVIGTITV